jgi:hypothetical protein
MVPLFAVSNGVTVAISSGAIIAVRNGATVALAVDKTGGCSWEEEATAPPLSTSIPTIHNPGGSEQQRQL